MAATTDTLQMHFPAEEFSSGIDIHYFQSENAVEIPLHSHPFYEIYYFQESAPDSYIVGNKCYSIRPGDILILPPEVAHKTEFAVPGKPSGRYVLWLSQETVQQMEKLDAGLLTVLHTCRDGKSYRIRNASQNVKQLLEADLNTMWMEQQEDSACKAAYLYSICLHFLVLLNRVMAEDQSLLSRQPLSDAMAEQILNYVHENYTSDISLNSVAEHFFTSPSNIETMLTRKLGKPFYRYVTECRIIRAQALILSGVPLKEVGITCGYNDYSNFYRAFTRETGISPSEFRRKLFRNHFQATHIQHAKFINTGLIE